MPNNITGVELMTAMTTKPKGTVSIEMIDKFGAIISTRQILSVGVDGPNNFIQVFASAEDEAEYLEYEAKLSK